MSEEQDRDLPHEEEIAEIELSAEQLRGLTQTRRSAAPAANATLTAPSQAAAAEIAAPPGVGRWKAAAAFTGMGSVLALAATIGYQGMRSAPAVPPPAPAVEQIEEPQPPQVIAQVSEEPPVLVPNPFDKSEVFEFPAGTTPDAARAAIADTLLERARERQAEYDAKHPKRRRSRPG
jgi:hypothetical protein